MPRFSANLSWLYQELPFIERFHQAKTDGFDAVECLFPYDVDKTLILSQLLFNKLDMVLINAPAGDWQQGDRGLAIYPQHMTTFRELFSTQALPTALALKCPFIHVMAGVLKATDDRRLAEQTFMANLEWALDTVSTYPITLLIEPISHHAIANYYLTHQQQAISIIKQFKTDKLKLQLDLFHCQLTEGALTKHIENALDLGLLGHVQIAGVPQRNEPDSGEVYYPYLFDLLDHYNYQGHIGCEYAPKTSTTEGLKWFHPYRK
ncbi:MAG: TIM barrel protein [Betaproteobacteria bacterium]|nr:TIM barrel protein [Betaproteobacteria bacterium]MDE2423891.1 TIM barrel protein [Betaproteobacteria bacterium]